jgi:signal transduction histidine kinase/ligand-binding sensor domain-containing protein/DNA-binding response OmpR family regulator
VEEECMKPKRMIWNWIGQATCLLLILAPGRAFAQSDIRFEEVQSINPLSHNNVTYIHQDQLGFLWIGTFNGLNKYDGYSFKIYTFNDLEQEHASTNRISAIHESSNGMLWIETYDGNYQCFNPFNETFYSIPELMDSCLQVRFTHFYEAGEGTVCLSTEKSGVLFINDSDTEGGPVIHHLVNRPGEDRVLTDNSVNFVVQDVNKYFWVGTENGLTRIHEDDVAQEHPRVLKYFTERSFTTFALVGQRLWFGNEVNGVTWYDPASEQFGYIQEENGQWDLNGMDVTTLKSNGDHLWIGTSVGKVFRYDQAGKELKEFKISDPMSGSVINQVYCDIFEQVWLLTEEFGITRLDPSTGQFHYYSLSTSKTRNLIDDERIKIFEDSKNQLWLGGQNVGVQFYNREEDRFTAYINDPGDPTSLQSSVVEFLMEDREENLWVGTNWFGKGLSRMIKLDPAFKYVVPVPEPESKQQNVVRSVFTDSKGFIWAGTKSGQIYIYDPGLEQVHVIEKDPDINYSGYNVYSIVEDREGYVWLCTKGAGIFRSNQSVKEISPRYERLTFTNIRHDPDNPNSLNNNNVYDIELDDLNRVWVATYGGGLNLIEADEKGERVFHRFTTDNSTLSSDNLRDLYLDRHGRLWLASTLGVNYIDIYRQNITQPEIGNIFSDPAEHSGLSYNDIIMIMEDSNGHLWLASAGGGVNVILNPDGEEFQFDYYSTREGVKDDYILSLAEDIYGFIWIGTASGLSRYNPVTRDIDNFDKKVGLPEVSFSERTAVATNSGKIFFGTVNGFYSISPDMAGTEESNPMICLTELMLNNVEVRPGDEDSPLKRSISFAREVTLRSNQSNFSIGFSLLSFKSPESNHYSYTLEGFDEGWNYIGTDHKATFTNVPPGSYTFRVKGLDSDLSEYGTETKLAITILPPLWRTKAAYAIYAVLMIILIYLGYRVALRFVRLKNNLKVEKKVAESKLRFFTNISHEIRTPLTLILGPVDRMISETNLPSEVRHQLAVVHRNTKRLLRMVNMILDFRKVQHEKITLRIQEIELIPFLHQIYESFEAQAQQKNIHFSLIYDQTDEHLTVWGDVQKLDIVIFNLLSNAFKFTPENRRISIIVSRVYESKSWIKIQVCDTGIGIEKDKLDLVFNRFFVSHTDESNEYQGTGIGLSLSQEYVNLHQGEIRVESTPGKGTDFIVKLLTGNSHFPDDVIFKEREAYSYSPRVITSDQGLLKDDLTEPIEHDEEEKPHILIVEDDVEMCYYLQRILEKQYNVDISKDGLDGWKKALEVSPDLVVTDIMMPGMNGIELTQKLKEEFKTCHIPVIMLSSKSAVESQVEGLQIGAEAYVPKPFNSEILLSYIQTILSQRKRVRAIFENRVELKPDEVQVTPKDKEFIEKVLNLIDENLANPEFNVEKLATKIFISRTLFYKKIKSITGYQPVELIRMMRLKKAAKFIETGEFTVSEVAYMVGYNDIRYFSTSFKKQFGVSPSQYQAS